MPSELAILDITVGSNWCGSPMNKECPRALTICAMGMDAMRSLDWALSSRMPIKHEDNLPMSVDASCVATIRRAFDTNWFLNRLKALPEMSAELCPKLVW